MSESPGESRMPMSRRLALLKAGFKSMAGRYPKDFAGAMRREHHPARSDLALAEAWQKLPKGDGLTGVAWLGHCTLLLRIGGRTILTDPVLSPSIGMKLWRLKLGPARLHPAPVTIDQLPPIDLILISHAHFDHLDKETLRKLAAINKKVPVVTAEKTKRLVPNGQKGFASVSELAWQQEMTHGPVKITAIKPRHWGARTGWDRHRGYNAYVIEAQGQRLLFAGDTAYTSAFDDWGPIDVAIFGIGAYDPWHHAHATPEQVWKMAQSAACKLVMPVHHSTFKLSDEPVAEPLERLKKAAGEEGERVLAVEIGRVEVFGK